MYINLKSLLNVSQAKERKFLVQNKNINSQAVNQRSRAPSIFSNRDQRPLFIRLVKYSPPNIIALTNKLKG